MGGKTRGGSIGSTVAGKGKAVMGVQKGVPDLPSDKFQEGTDVGIFMTVV